MTCNLPACLSAWLFKTGQFGTLRKKAICTLSYVPRSSSRNPPRNLSPQPGGARQRRGRRAILVVEFHTSAPSRDRSDSHGGALCKQDVYYRSSESTAYFPSTPPSKQVHPIWASRNLPQLRWAFLNIAVECHQENLMFKGIGFRVLGMSPAYTQDLQGFPFVRRFQMSAAGFFVNNL